MPPGWPKGVPRGSKPPNSGREKGTPNKVTQAMRDRLVDLGCDIVQYLALTVLNKVPCAVCRGVGKTKFQPAHSERFEGVRTCQSCWGSGLERTDPKQSAWAAAELLQYCAPKLKAVEHSGEIALVHQMEQNILNGMRRARGEVIVLPPAPLSSDEVVQ